MIASSRPPSKRQHHQTGGPVARRRLRRRRGRQGLGVEIRFRAGERRSSSVPDGGGAERRGAAAVPAKGFTSSCLKAPAGREGLFVDRPENRRTSLWTTRGCPRAARRSHLCGDEPSDGEAFGPLMRLFRWFLKTLCKWVSEGESDEPPPSSRAPCNAVGLCLSCTRRMPIRSTQNTKGCLVAASPVCPA
jgi:hypothetical protein